MKLCGAKIILECLKEQKVDTIFGYPGGAVIPLYDALYDYQNDFFHVRTSHEQGLVHAADGYARSSGKVGVCFATSGPGATNTVTGIATAYMDSIPMVVITGQVSSGLLGKDSFQEIDITAVTQPITKYNFIIKDISKLADTIRQAFQIATSGRPGPVLVDVTKDVFFAEADYEKKNISLENSYDEEYSKDDIYKACNLINCARRPVICAGGGVILSNASKLLFELSTKADIPVANTLMGLGSFDRTNPLSVGMIGMHGLYESNMAVTQSDLIIALGARFSDRVIGKVDKFAPEAKIIHIDIDNVEIGKNKQVDLWLVGDIKNILSKIIQNIYVAKHDAWRDTIDDWRSEVPKATLGFNPENIIKTAYDLANGNAIVTTDVGQHQMWTAQYWKFKNPRTFLSSGGLGTMGFGLGAAIGAKVAKPNTKVIHISGDGSFRMNCNELATVSKYKLPVVTILFNNSALGMVRQWQGEFNNKRYSQTDVTDEVDYIKLSEAFGIKGARATNIDEFRLALSQAFKENRAALIECKIEKDEKVIPFVPPGKPINEMLLK